MTPEEAVNRWDAFLSKIEERCQQTLAEAQQGCAALLDVAGLDPLPMSNAWSAIENQIVELTSRIDDTWSEKVEPAFEEADWEWDQIEPQLDRGRALSAKMLRDRDAVAFRIFAEAAEKIFEEAKKNLAQDHPCTQCHAPLPLSDQFFRSVHVTCPYCNNVNTFVPGTKIASVEHFCCHHLSRARTVDLWFAWVDAEERMRDTETLENMKAAEAALKQYNEAYLKARIAIVPELEKDFEKDLQGRMAFFYEEVSRSDEWDGIQA